MIAEIKAGKAFGSISAPPSKSMAHRLLICAAMSEGVSTVRRISLCDDALATIDCLRALGAKIDILDDVCRIEGVDMRRISPRRELFCRESASTLRFIIPIAMLSRNEVKFCGADSLMKRPLSVYEDIFRERELRFEARDNSIYLKGPLRSGKYTISGNVSSQFISGLLFALPILDGDSEITIIPPFESRAYIDLTLQSLKKFGVTAEFSDEFTITVKGNQKYICADLSVEGDYSSAAFCDAFNLLGGDVKVTGICEHSLQGDKVYKQLYKKLLTNNAIIDVSDCPDLSPILFALAAALNGAEFTGTKRLKIKESDRAYAMKIELEKLGADIEIYENSVRVKKCPLHKPNETLFGHSDHRIVMSLAVLLSLFGGKIDGAEAVKKSYPSFFEDVKALGIDVKFREES